MKSCFENVLKREVKEGIVMSSTATWIWITTSYLMSLTVKNIVALNFNTFENQVFISWFKNLKALLSLGLLSKLFYVSILHILRNKQRFKVVQTVYDLLMFIACSLSY